MANRRRHTVSSTSPRGIDVADAGLSSIARLPRWETPPAAQQMLADLPTDFRQFVLDGLGGSTVSAEIYVAPVDSLVLAESPRLAGEDAEHVRRLIEVEATLPPIVVHRTTMCVIDGRHRVRAAMASGRKDIRVRYFDGPEDYAFLLAVSANIEHGLPLSLADREAAAVRIIASYPLWSDRAIASATGLAPGTVSAIRRQLGLPTSTERLGRDGRIRPIDPAKGRRIASEIIARRPTASLRAIAKEAGISPATARDVRLRMERGEVPLRAGQRAAEGAAARSPGAVEGADTSTRAVRRLATHNRAGAVQASEAIVQGLRTDPSLRLTESGRTFLRWLLPRVSGPRGWNELADNIPPHCKYAVASLARNCASEWQRFADLMEQQARSTA
jgi:ParB-like chromosome segregation protein Spo0J